MSTAIDSSDAEKLSVKLSKEKKPDAREFASLKFITLVRCIYALLALASVLLWFQENSFNLQLMLGCVIEIFIFTGISSIALLKNRFIRATTYVGILHDACLAGFLVLISGYPSSPFMYLFLIIPLYGGIILKKWGGIVGALMTAFVSLIISFAVMPMLITGMPTRVKEALFPFIDDSILYNLSPFLPVIIASFCVGILTGHLSWMYETAQSRWVLTDREFSHLRNIYENILKALPIGVVIVNTDIHRIVYCNGSARQLLGETMENMFVSGNTSSIQENITKMKDKYVRIDSFSFSAAGQGSLNGYYISDITSQILAEQERARSQRLALLGVFSAKVAHEIRNPLACISGCNEMLEADVQNEDQKQIHEMMSSEIDRLNCLLNDILVFSRTPKLNTQRLRLRQLFLMQRDIFMGDPACADMRIELDINDDDEISADETAVKQICMTLWRNAAEAVQFHGTIHVMTHQNPFKIVFSDDGPGVSSEIASHIFEPFYTTKSHGTGLGLATARQLAIDNHLDLSWEPEMKAFVLAPIEKN